MKGRKSKRLEKFLECYEKYNSQISSSIFFVMAVTGAFIGALIGYGVSCQGEFGIIILATIIGMWVGSIIGAVVSIVCLILLESKFRKNDEDN